MYKPTFQKRSVLKFKHFSNHGYSLFSVLGKEVLIGVLSVATLQNATAKGISIETEKAETDSTITNRGIMMEEVNVTGTRAPLTVSQQARMVTVLSREDIQAAPVQSVNDLLKYAVGVDVRQKGPLGVLTDVSIRGGNSEQITVLLNGINICDAQTGHNSFDFPVDISEIERIEVLEGPAARVYGTSSLLGAINIVTRTPQRQVFLPILKVVPTAISVLAYVETLLQKTVGTISYQLLTLAVMAIFATRQAASTLITALQKFFIKVIIRMKT